MADRQHLEQLSKQLADNGKLVEVGWVAMHATTPHLLDIKGMQIKQLKTVFMVGAQHLFASIMTILEPGEEPTDADLNRMDLINDELETFRKEFILQVSKTQGRA